MAKDPEEGRTLYSGGMALVSNIERLIKMFLSLSRGTPQDWHWEGMLATALAAAGVQFNGKS